MKRLLISLCLVTVALLLQGCQTAPPPKPEVQYKTVLVTPPDALLRNCVVTPPPGRAAYLSADTEGREKLLADLASKQNENLAACNADKANLRVWKSKQQAIYP